MATSGHGNQWPWQKGTGDFFYMCKKNLRSLFAFLPLPLAQKKTLISEG